MTAEVKKEENPTLEELEKEKQEEEELLATPDAAKVRSKIIEGLGLDEDVNTKLIDKLVKEKLEDRKKFGKLVGQKRGWREKAQKKKDTRSPEEIKKEEEKLKKEKEEKEKKFLTQEDLDERDRKRDLESLEVSDALRTEVENYAKLHGCSVKKAFESDYIKFKKAEEDKQAEIDDASIGDKCRKTRTVSNIKALSNADLFKAIKEVDKSTEEGRKKHEEMKVELKRRG